MTAQKVPAVVQWALHGKAHDAEGYRILSASTGMLGKAHFSDALSRFTMAAADSLPQVAVSYLKYGTEPGVNYLALAVTRYADAQRYGDAVASRDSYGRETTFTSYFCAPYEDLAKAGVPYWDLYEAFGGIVLPVTDGPPKEITITASAERNPVLEDLAMRTAVLLLTGASVCVLGADNTRMEERLRFIDTVMDLLPYGFRSRMTAATWTKATNKSHKFRLFFSTAPRLGPQGDLVVVWDAPDKVEIPSGPAGDYYDSLAEKLIPISQLRTFTGELRFGQKDAIKACELLDTGRFRIRRPRSARTGGDRQYPQLPASRTAERQSRHGRRPQPTVVVRQPQAAAQARPIEQDPIDRALAECAARIKDDNTSGLRTDIRWLENQAQSATIDDARRRRYREQISRHKLLAPHPELRKVEGELYAALLSLAFGKPLSYDGYCKLEQCIGAARGARPHTALLNAIYRGGTADMLVRAIVLHHLDPVELQAWFKSGTADLVTMINGLAQPMDHPAHAKIFCAATLTYLKLYPGSFDPSDVQRIQPEVRRALRRHGFLAHVLAVRHHDDEGFQYRALRGFLAAAYPEGLTSDDVIQILTGGNHPPPTPALFATVFQLVTSQSDLEIACRAYAYGAATLLAVEPAVSQQLMARASAIDPRYLLPLAPAQDTGQDEQHGQGLQE
jgi:hypothetical protein